MVGVARGGTGTGGRAERGMHPAIVETARIVNVNIADWSVDAVGELGNRRFFDVQVMSPYLHYFNGEGVYVMPEVGAMCWVCQASSGLMANHFVLGFQTPVDARVDPDTGKQSANFRANRQNMNPGDIMLRTRDENFVILRRGGVVQIGAGPITQRMYIPIGNIIRDFCESYNLFTLGGEMSWEVDREDQSDAGDVQTRFLLKTKTKASDPEHAVTLAVGSIKDTPDLRFDLEVRPSGEQGVAAVVSLTIDKNGTVQWTVEKDFTLDVAENVTITSRTKNISFSAPKGRFTAAVQNDISLSSSDGGGSFLTKGDLSIKSSNGNINAKGKLISLDGLVALGGSDAKEPVILGLQLVKFLTALIQGFTDPSRPFGIGVAPGSPMLFPGMASLAGQLQSLLSQNSKTK